MTRLGAWVEDGWIRLRTWAPGRRQVEAVFESGRLPMRAEPDGMWSLSMPDSGGRLQWKISLDGGEPLPDPASGWQPTGVHGPSALDRGDFTWTDEGWRGVSMKQLVLYELHVGAATREGTFDALIPHLDHLRELGVTAVELMPVATFPGTRNWGYDGTFWCAPSQLYGGPEALRRLVDAAHARGLAVMLDVVLNHFGPAGNYLWTFARDAFTDRHRTPWGEALDWTKPGLRQLAVSCVERWIRDFHLDGLRLDATHAIFDDAPSPHLLQELADAARSAAPDRTVLMIAEDDRNEASLLRSVDEGGLGLDGVWADDFHHVMRHLIAGDADGYFADYEGTVTEVARVIERGWLYEGEPSKFRNAPRGTSPEGLPPERFVHFLQNHDQIGNRALGDRLGAAVDVDVLLAATAVLLLSPHVPLLFMGQEWNTTTSFPFFTDHEPDLGRAVTEGRRREFAAFTSFGGELPDPQARRTFDAAALDWSECLRPGHAQSLAWHRSLLSLRHTHPAIGGGFQVRPLGSSGLLLHLTQGPAALAVVASFGAPLEHRLEGSFRLLLSTDAPEFGGRSPARLDGAMAFLGGAGAVVVESA